MYTNYNITLLQNELQYGSARGRTDSVSMTTRSGSRTKPPLKSKFTRQIISSHSRSKVCLSVRARWRSCLVSTPTKLNINLAVLVMEESSVSPGSGSGNGGGGGSGGGYGRNGSLRVTTVETLRCGAGFRNFCFVKMSTTDPSIVGWSEYLEERNIGISQARHCIVCGCIVQNFKHLASRLNWLPPVAHVLPSTD